MDALQEFIEFWKKYGQHITAFSVLFLLIFSAFQIVKFNKLQEEINQNCGWEDEDENYYCVCEKGAVQIAEALINKEVDINFSIPGVE